MWVNRQLHSPAALILGKEPHCPLNSRLSGPQDQSGYSGGKTNLLSPARNQTMIFQMFSPQPSQCTNYAIPGTCMIMSKTIKKVERMHFVKHYEKSIMINANYTAQLSFLWYIINTPLHQTPRILHSALSYT
jgi:hypothetical protein